MLVKPKNYEEIEVKEFTEFEEIKLGGHACIIKAAEEYIGSTGNKSLRIQVDIDKTDKQAGFYEKQYNSSKTLPLKWSNCATKYYSLKESDQCASMLKGLITAIEKSNANFIFDWENPNHLESLVNKKIAGVFGMEQYAKQDGTVTTINKLTQIRSLDKLDEIQIPKVKKMDGSYVDLEVFLKEKDFLIIDDIEDCNDLPF
ncbi:MAG: hypothetical protein RR662_07160 [Clostridia bacterium]